VASNVLIASNFQGLVILSLVGITFPTHRRVLAVHPLYGFVRGEQSVGRCDQEIISCWI